MFIAKDEEAMSKKSTKLEALCETFRENGITSLPKNKAFLYI